MILLLMVLSLAVSQEEEERSLIDDEVEEYPAEFRGTWAPTAAHCKREHDIETITIGRTKIWSYEADSKLLKLTPLNHFSGPGGTAARSVHALVAERGEMELAVGKVRLTLAGGKLYTSRVDEVSDEEQWKYGNVRCS